MNVPIIDLQAQFKTIEPQVTAAVLDVIAHQDFVLGRAVKLFEEEVKSYLGVQHAVGLGSGTDALTFALEALGVGPGDCVITTPFTFFATIESILQTGAEPVFVDIDRKTYNLDAGALEDYLRKKTRRLGEPHALMDVETGLRVRAILPVHIYGTPADMPAIRRLADRYELPMIEDACQAFGTRIRLGSDSGDAYGLAGNLSNAGCFSFYPSKCLGGYGDGGMVVTNDERLAAHVRSRGTHGEKEKNRHALVGRTSRLDTIQAAVLRVKLARLPEWNKDRLALARRYNEKLEHRGLTGNSGIGPEPKNPIVTPVIYPDHEPIFYLYSIRAHRRDALRGFLTQQGIGTAVHYPIPAYRQDCLRGHVNPAFMCPVTEEICREILSIPIYPEMTHEQQDYVIDAITRFYESAG